jgi:hypothetical protein
MTSAIAFFLVTYAAMFVLVHEVVRRSRSGARAAGERRS